CRGCACGPVSQLLRAGGAVLREGAVPARLRAVAVRAAVPARAAGPAGDRRRGRVPRGQEIPSRAAAECRRHGVAAVTRRSAPRAAAAASHDTHTSQERSAMTQVDVKSRRVAALASPPNLGRDAARDISAALNLLLADAFALYLKTKNFHWHVSGPHFRDYHLLLDEQAGQIFAATDDIAERVRKVGGTTLRSIGEIGRLQRVLDNDADYVTPLDMLAELRDD